MPKQLFILVDSFGNRSLVPASIDAATELYLEHKEYLAPEVKEILAYRIDRKAHPTDLANPATLMEALVDLLEKDAGSPSRALRFLMHGNKKKGLSYDQDDRPPVFVQEDWKKEVAAWILPYVFEGHRSMSNWKSVVHNATISRKAHPEEDLAFLEPFRLRMADNDRPLVWTYPEYFDQAEEAKVIESRNWKVDAKIERVVQRILNFVNQLTHRDVKYEVVEIATNENQKTANA